jgi:hypothetical protein
MLVHMVTKTNRNAAIDAQIAEIDRLLAALKSMTPLQRAEFDRTLRAANRTQDANAAMARVFGK